MFHKKISSVLAHPFAKSSAIVFIGTMGTNVLAYLYHLVVGRILGPEKYGELAALFSLSYILNVAGIVVQTVTAKYVASYAAKDEVGKSKHFVISATRNLTIVSVVVCIVSLPFWASIAHFLHVQNAWFVGFIVLASILFFLSTILVGALQGLKKFADIMIYGNISMVARLIGGAIGALYGVGVTAFAHLATTVISFVLSAIPLRFLAKVKQQPTQLTTKAISAYAVPSFVGILGITSLYSSDVILVKHFFTPFEAGVYAALAMMGKIIYFAGSSVGYVLLPTVAHRQASGEKSHKIVYVSIAAVAGISFILTIGYFLFPDLAMGLLFGSSYLAGAKYLGLFGLFITFFSLANLLITTLLGLAKTGASWIVFAASIVQIVGIFLFHASLEQVLYVNIWVCALLFGILLLYYRHE